jgi:hypothetical protein
MMRRRTVAVALELAVAFDFAVAVEFVGARHAVPADDLETDLTIAADLW